MKTKLLLIPLILFALACGDEKPVAPAPIACFNYNPEADIKVGDEIIFTNCSENATAYSWDFGDGNTSTDENPTHVFTEAREYTITLVATGVDKEHAISSTISIIPSANYIEINGIQYPLGSKGFLQSFGAPRAHDLYIGAENFNFETEKGNGALLQISYLWGKDEYDIAGDYSLVPSDPTDETTYFVISDVVLAIGDLDYEPYTYTVHATAVEYLDSTEDFEMSILKTGNIYTIQISFKSKFDIITSSLKNNYDQVEIFWTGTLSNN